MWKANLILALFLAAWFVGLKYTLDKYDNTPAVMQAMMEHELQIAKRNAGACSVCYAQK